MCKPHPRPEGAALGPWESTASSPQTYMSVHSPGAGQAWLVWVLGEVSWVGIYENSSRPKVLGTGHLGKEGAKELFLPEKTFIRVGKASKSEMTHPLICSCRAREAVSTRSSSSCPPPPPHLPVPWRPQTPQYPVFPVFLFPVQDLLILFAPMLSYNPLGSVLFSL